MRAFLFATLMASAAFPACAASIEKVKTGQIDGDGSIMTVSCEDCQSAQARKRNYQVPQLNGVASMEIVDENGKPQVVRVDKFLGGSPVTTTSKTQAQLIEEMAAIEKKAHEAKQAARQAQLQAIDMKSASILPPDERGARPLPGIDREATTAALSTETASFDPSQLTLRLR
ncbi:plant virulence effector HPE1-like domain-containing protein [Rhizobium sp. C1]|uniref:plant virulence effector HPE1-like domain-containing protein n=1 Tax=Rhizobium sp. C1 TaxID=1349799 RepID=UPI001E4F5B47|nr:plant virulence effector HPE1-like domain-containing protein [Rhizobium sp. C1]MCD2179710.1 hypothetical protein [Rhizobium sp. C1]